MYAKEDIDSYRDMLKTVEEQLKTLEELQNSTISDLGIPDPNKIKEMVSKYSDYIRYPIQMMCTESKLKEGSKDE